MTLTKQFNQKSFEDNYTLFRGSEGVRTIEQDQK